MEECFICYEDNITNWKILSCCHKMCYNCYIKLTTNKCPYCRNPFEYSNNDMKIKILSPPPAQIMTINFLQVNSVDNTLINYNEPFSGLFRRQKNRRRRRNLSETEILERRKIIRERCQNKWIRKNGRLEKIE
jgi:hypothetical protein